MEVCKSNCPTPLSPPPTTTLELMPAVGAISGSDIVLPLATLIVSAAAAAFCYLVSRRLGLVEMALSWIERLMGGEDEEGMQEAASTAPTSAGYVRCPVCLRDIITEEELARNLPGCGHGFHEECINRWLINHGTCPVCRAHVTAELSADNEDAADAQLADAAV